MFWKEWQSIKILHTRIMYVKLLEWKKNLRIPSKPDLEYNATRIDKNAQSLLTHVVPISFHSCKLGCNLLE